MKKLTTLEIEIAMFEYLNFRANIVVPCVSYGINDLDHECDMLKVTPSGYATEVEIKISRADLRKDKEKLHGHRSYLIKCLYFAVPYHLRELALEEIPERAGLLVVTYDEYNQCYEVNEVKEPVINKQAKAWGTGQRLRLALLGAMRAYVLKKKVHKLQSKLKEENKCTKNPTKN